MTNITELAQSLKAAAGKATKGQWVAFTDTASRTFSVHTPDDYRCGDVIKWAGFDGQCNAKADAEFIAMANPANILALVEALEKAKTKAIERGRTACELFDEVTALRQRIAELESRTVKLPDELSGETLLDNYSDVAYSDDTGVLEYTNIVGCFVKITAPPDKVIRFRWSNEGMHIRLVDRVKTHEHAGIIVDFPKNYKDFIQ